MGIPEWLKKLAPLVGWLAGGIVTVAPSNTIAYKIALGVMGILAGHGVSSTGVER